jgi:hypothetical protein
LAKAAGWPLWREEPEDLEASVRSYLDANCAFCHSPTGPGNSRIDLRAGIALAQARLLDEPPGQGDLGVAGARQVARGDPAKSVLLMRMRRTDEKGMPNLSHGVVDEVATRRIERWIRGLR